MDTVCACLSTNYNEKAMDMKGVELTQMDLSHDVPRETLNDVDKSEGFGVRRR